MDERNDRLEHRLTELETMSALQDRMLKILNDQQKDVSISIHEMRISIRLLEERIIPMQILIKESLDAIKLSINERLKIIESKLSFWGLKQLFGITSAILTSNLIIVVILKILGIIR